MTKKLIDAIHDNRELVSKISWRMADLARTFQRLGLMPEIADELDYMAGNLDKSAKEVSAAYSVDLGDKLRHSEVMAGNMLKMALNNCLKEEQ